MVPDSRGEVGGERDVLDKARGLPGRGAAHDLAVGADDRRDPVGRGNGNAAAELEGTGAGDLELLLGLGGSEERRVAGLHGDHLCPTAHLDWQHVVVGDVEADRIGDQDSAGLKWSVSATGDEVARDEPETRRPVADH